MSWMLKRQYITRWKHLADQHSADAFTIKENETRPISKVIAEVAREKKITQIILGQTAQSRWEQIAKGSIINALFREIPFVDLHIISVSRYLKNPDMKISRRVYVLTSLRSTMTTDSSLNIQRMWNLKGYSSRNLERTLIMVFSNL